MKKKTPDDEVAMSRRSLLRATIGAAAIATGLSVKSESSAKSAKEHAAKKTGKSGGKKSKTLWLGHNS